MNKKTISIVVGLLALFAALTALRFSPLAFAQETVPDETPTLLRQVIESPQFLAALMALGWNIAGYVSVVAAGGKLEPYSKGKLIETLVLFEGLLTVTVTFAGLPQTWATSLTLTLVFIRNLKASISDLAQALTTQKTAAPT